MKGVSPLIAAVLLIAFTVSVSMIIMGWFSTFTRTTTSNVSATTTEAIGCNSASINIEHVYTSASSSTATIIVKNTGFKELSSIQGMLINSSGSSCASDVAYNVSKGTMVQLNLSACPNITQTTCGTFDRAVVTTSCGGVDDVVTSTADLTCNA